MSPRALRLASAVASFALLALVPLATSAQTTIQGTGQPARESTTDLARYPRSHVAAADSLLMASNMETMLAGMAERTVQSQLQAMPQLAPFADIFREFMFEQMDWKVLRPEFLALYVQTFSESELREVTAFYRTPLGQKLLAKSPELMARAMELSNRRVQAAMPRMLERIQARAAELQREGKPLTAPPGTP